MADVLRPPPRATAVIVIGMAGSGKSTFVGKLTSHLATKAELAEKDPEAPPARRPYVINIDPAVGSLGYAPNVDIRDTVDYGRVMEQYNLGPNGAILTSLNLFTTKFDQVLQIVDRRAPNLDHVVLDTPGQIEIFTWSASGAIITDALATSLPTVIVYVIDTPRTTAPATFMSNMLYACSIMYKSKLPFILVFNKTDVQSPRFAFDWMQDFESFQQALAAGNATDPSVFARDENAKVPSFRERGEEPSYLNSLMNSMCLMLDEFYKNLRAVGVSSATGEGMDDFLAKVEEARQEYLDDYRPALEKQLAEKREQLSQHKESQLERLARDMKKSNTDDEPEAQYDGDGEIIDPDTDEERPEPGFAGGDRRRGAWNKLDGTYWPKP
ncbi:hypothetical protein MCUN1_003575 [Malassezia cuniculi]|uniref:GPN-loop GTPase n=1 Tax=Malassezia cuniculi TaxID=948313 RepID=A0AAF0J7X7_9BASI|nr:hypothetical protein MCUN1_003575 [Malassezia cuniculi]